MPTRVLTKIAIVGSGPAGLTLASCLLARKAPVDITIFELRPAVASIDYPSGSLDLHMDSGLLALEMCGLTEKFKQVSGECSEQMILADKDAVVKHTDSGSGERPEIPRNTLVHIILDTIPPHLIKWNTKVINIHQNLSSRRWILEHQTKSIKNSEEFDLVVGADGAHSRIRPLLTSVEPHYSTVNCITLNIPNISSMYPDLAEMIGKGTYNALAYGKNIGIQRGTHDSARIYVFLSSEDPDFLKTSGLTVLAKEPESLAIRLVDDEAFFGKWSPKIKKLLSVACRHEGELAKTNSDGILIYPLTMLPIEFKWNSVAGVTLIGDAAHLMTPFAGEGVNCAMLDALRLSEAIATSLLSDGGGHLITLHTAVGQAEKEMWDRMKPISQGTWDNLRMIMNDQNAPDNFVQFFASIAELRPEN